MDTSYIPTHLYCVERQMDGWPCGVTPEQKIETVQAIREVLDEHKEGVTLEFLQKLLKYRELPVLKKALLWDWIYAVIHRGLLAVDGVENVYRISKTQYNNEQLLKEHQEKEAKKEERQQKRLAKKNIQTLP